MLRKQLRHATNDTALARVGSADAAALVATPAAASPFTAPQQATISAACTPGSYGRVMAEPYAVNDASWSQEHNPLPVIQLYAVAASQEIFAGKGCSAMVVNADGQVIGSEVFTKRSSSNNRAGHDVCHISFFDQAWCWLVVATPGV